MGTDINERIVVNKIICVNNEVSSWFFLANINGKFAMGIAIIKTYAFMMHESISAILRIKPTVSGMTTR